MKWPLSGLERVLLGHTSTGENPKCSLSLIPEASSSSEMVPRQVQQWRPLSFDRRTLMSHKILQNTKYGKPTKQSCLGGRAGVCRVGAQTAVHVWLPKWTPRCDLRTTIWGSKSKPLDVAFGDFLDIPPVLFSSLVLGHSLLYVLYPRV